VGRRRGAPERAHPEVRERGAEPPTPPAAAIARSVKDGGEGGIRTRDGLPRTAFPVRRHSPLGDLSAETCASSAPGVGGSSARRDGGFWQGRVRAPEQAHPKVRERGAQARTPPGAVRSGSVCGGEGGIRTRGAFAHRFSRAAPSTTRTPLRGGGYQTVGPTRPGGPSGRAPQPTGAVGAVAKSARASSRRIPLTTLMRRLSESCCASWMTVPAAPLRSSARA
jgi:hypothetical protein